MVRKVFYSFHYDLDCKKAALVKNMGVIEGNNIVMPNEWEEIKRGGQNAIRQWIDRQIDGRTCTIVLIGEETSERPWIDYEIRKTWQENKALLGINIHNLKALDVGQTPMGKNPFTKFSVDTKNLSEIVKTYNPPYSDSRDAYGYIKDNLADWVEKAIEIRNRY